MRPLLLHASSSCALPKSRRVIHLEFAAAELPHGLDWHDRIPMIRRIPSPGQLMEGLSSNRQFQTTIRLRL
jgi:hypothetical protein